MEMLIALSFFLLVTRFTDASCPNIISRLGFSISSLLPQIDVTNNQRGGFTKAHHWATTRRDLRYNA